MVTRWSGPTQDAVEDGGLDVLGEDATEPVEEVVQQHPGQHGGEEQGGVVVVHVQHPAHRPEGDVVQGPAQEEPRRGTERLLPGLAQLRSLLPAALLPEARPGVHRQEDQQEDDVAPPDQGVAKQVDTCLVVTRCTE